MAKLTLESQKLQLRRMSGKYSSTISFCEPPAVRHIRGLSTAARLLCPEVPQALSVQAVGVFWVSGKI